MNGIVFPQFPKSVPLDAACQSVGLSAESAVNVVADPSVPRQQPVSGEAGHVHSMLALVTERRFHRKPPEQWCQ